MKLAILQSLGIVPVVKLSLKIVVRNGAISMASSFSTLAGMRSGPGALLGLSLSRRFTLPPLLTLISGIAGYGTPFDIIMLLVSSFCPRRSILPVYDVGFVRWVGV